MACSAFFVNVSSLDHEAPPIYLSELEIHISDPQFLSSSPAQDLTAVFAIVWQKTYLANCFFLSRTIYLIAWFQIIIYNGIHF